MPSVRNNSPEPSPREGRAGDHADSFDLLERARAGDREALADLLRRYEQLIYNLCLRMSGTHGRDLAGELAQDALVRIIEKLHTFDGRSLLSTWIYRVTANVCLSRLRAERVREHVSLGGHDPVRNANATPGSGREVEPDAASGIQRHERWRRVIAALDTLDGDQRLILLLRDAHALDYEAISRTLGVPVGTVKSRLFRARAALRSALERLENPPRTP